MKTLLCRIVSNLLRYIGIWLQKAIQSIADEIIKFRGVLYANRVCKG